MRASRWFVLLLPVCVAATPLAKQAPAGGTFTLVKVDVKGTKRYTADAVVRVSGLQTGQPVTVAALGAAVERLAGTGLFKTVTYEYKTTAAQLSATVDIEEEAWTVPVILDNFIWFGDQELTKALGEAVPSFDGTSPANEDMTRFIAGALQHIIDGRHIPGRVEFMPHVNLKTRATQYVFAVKGAPGLTMCALHVNGASAVPERDLLLEAQNYIGTDYSRSFITEFANGTLQRVYRKRGYWKAGFDAPVAAADAGCGGIGVTLAVTEGSAYVWDHAEWSGNAAIPSSRLDMPLGMKPGEVADVSKIEQGLRNVHAIYEKVGYLGEDATLDPRLDDETRRAVFQISVAEGPQFHMGTIEILGVPAADAESLLKKWRLAPGDVYDGSYLNQFGIDSIRPLQARGALPRAFDPQFRADPARRIVDVKIVFK